MFTGYLLRTNIIPLLLLRESPMHVRLYGTFTEVRSNFSMPLKLIPTVVVGGRDDGCLAAMGPLRRWAPSVACGLPPPA
eukprot:COSAG06_NODE_1241_length_10121_cov_45.270206_4_plen_79_part_00